MPQLTAIDGSGSPAECAQAEVCRDQYYLGTPPNLGVGLIHAFVGALCGLISLLVFFALTQTADSAVDAHWPIFILAGALIGWFLRFDPNGEHP